VAKHRQAKNRRASAVKRGTRQRRQSPSLLFLGTTAAAVSTVLVFGHATNTTADSPQVQLTAATIGIGGRGDPDAVNIPNKLQAKVVPFGTDSLHYIGVQYPAGFDIDNSVNAGVPVLAGAITNNKQDAEGRDQFLLVVGYSEGAVVAEKVRRNLDPDDPGAPSAGNLEFVMIASPNIPNGGIFARFPGLGIPFVVTSNGAAEPSPYDTTYVWNEYDPYADFPAYFNPLSLANTLFAVVYVHPDQYYDSVDYDPLNNTTSDPNVLVKTVTHTVDGHESRDTYVFVRAEHLPLFAPLRQIASIAQLTPLTEPVLSAIEPLVRLVVDMGYTDRANLNPETPVQFSLITPPGKVLEAAAGVPGALGQGVTNLVTGAESLPGSIPTPLAPTNSPPINAKSQPQEPQLSLVKSDPTPVAATDPAEQQEPSDSNTPTTEPPVSTLSETGPTLGAVTEDGNKTTPNTTTKTTTPKKNVFTQLADSFKKFLSGNKTPTPSSNPTDSTPTDSTPQGQSEGPTSNAA
jgi:hypothetical protein